MCQFCILLYGIVITATPNGEMPFLGLSQWIQYSGKALLASESDLKSLIEQYQM